MVWLAAMETLPRGVYGEIFKHGAGGRGAVEHGARLGQKAAADLGQFDAAPHAVEQLCPVAGLQRADGGRHRRLRHADAFGGPRHVTALGNRDKNAELIKCHDRN